MNWRRVVKMKGLPELTVAVDVRSPIPKLSINRLGEIAPDKLASVYEHVRFTWTMNARRIWVQA